MTNLYMPGNARYQPKSLQSYFGYDSLTSYMVEVEIASMRALGRLGKIPKEDMDLLTPDLEAKLLRIPTTLVDRVERTDTDEYGKATKHDVRALVHIMQDMLPEPLRKWVHVPLTSYDVIDTARVLMFRRAHEEVVLPKACEVIQSLTTCARKYAEDVQVGRSHGQHALPITVGFWLASIISRAITNLSTMDNVAADFFVGKISGPVGAYNAQAALGLYEGNGARTFEGMVLEELDLKPAPISTQILPPEPMAYYLFCGMMLSAALGQYALDCRQLMRPEIRELAEPFEDGQVGSSTMPHKRNPMTFENVQGMAGGVILEFGKVLATLNSEHQRDLVGSSIMRDFPTIVVKLVQQLETLLRPGRDDPRPFIERVVVDHESCLRNLSLQGGTLLAEPMYLQVQVAGYDGDAHELVNHRVVEMARSQDISLVDAIERVAQEDSAVAAAWGNVPLEQREQLRDVNSYVGKATEKTLEICEAAKQYLRHNP